MKNASIHIKWKRLLAIPKKYYALWLALAVAFFICLALLLRPADAWISKIQTVELPVEEVSVRLSRGKHPQYHLEMESGGECYYLWYPRGTYRQQYEAAAEALLLSGRTATVTAKILNNSSLWDVLLGRHRIVDLRSGEGVFYALETELSRERTDRLVLGLLIVPIGIVWVVDSLFLLFGYDVVSLRNKPKKKHP